MTSPLVSVLTPSYNYARYIGDCLDSVANQTYAAIEHVVVDGASTDDTTAVLRGRGPSLRWVSEPDRGQSHALNKALAMAQGEIIGWLNADDAYADRRAVAAAVRIFEARPDVGAVYGHSLLINGSNRILQLMWTPSYSSWLLRRMTTFTQPAVFLRRSVLPEPFVQEDLRFVMDRDLWLRLVDKTLFQRLDLVVAVDRQHSERKVMSDAYLVERDSYSRQQATAPLAPQLAKAISVACRLQGLLRVPTLAGSIDPALDLRFDRMPRLAARQAMLPRRFMAVD